MFWLAKTEALNLPPNAVSEEAQAAAMDNLKNKVPGILEEIESEFRSLLGVK